MQNIFRTRKSFSFLWCCSRVWRWEPGEVWESVAALLCGTLAVQDFVLWVSLGGGVAIVSKGCTVNVFCPVF